MTSEEIRIECLKLAMTMRNVRPGDPLDLAKEYERYVCGTEAEAPPAAKPETAQAPGGQGGKTPRKAPVKRKPSPA